MNALLVVSGALAGFALGLRCLPSPRRAPSVSGPAATAGATGSPPVDSRAGSMPRSQRPPRTVEIPERPGSARALARARERDAQVRELRAAVQWRAWDEYEAAIQRCGADDGALVVCWYRLDARVDGDEVQLARGRVVECKRYTAATMTTPAAAPQVATCVGAAVGPLDDVHLDATTAAALAGFDDAIELELRVQRRAAAP